MPYQEGQTAGNGAYIFQNGGWVTNPARAPVTGPAGSNPSYQANANATPTGQPIPGPTFEGRGLPGGTPGQKAGNLATAVSSGYGAARALGTPAAGLAAATKSTPATNLAPDEERFISHVQNTIKGLQSEGPSQAAPAAQNAVQSAAKSVPGPGKPSDWGWISKLTTAEAGKDLIGHMIKALLNAP